ACRKSSNSEEIPARRKRHMTRCIKRQIGVAARVLLGVAAAIAAAHCATAAAEEAYTVQLFHPRQPDDLQRVHVIWNSTLEEITKKQKPEKSHKTEKGGIEFTAAYNGVEVEKDGVPTHLNCSLEKGTLKLDPGPAATELFKPNTIVDIEFK